MRRFTLLTVVLSSTVTFLIGLIIAGGVTPGPVVSSAARRPAAAPEARPASARAAAGLVNFADVAERINPAVVNIDATSKTSRERRRGEDLDPGRELDGPRQGSGSGFLIDREGYILTNHHVIAGAERITVTMADGRAFRGQVVGSDPAIDVALLKVPADGRLPEAALGNSDSLRVGEWVCAIGNPLGYVHSVTVGVVSFIGRKLFDKSLDDYIQTDAAINFGNSGGPLINSAGEVVGINSAISSRASNIGFAVPINQAVAILPQLKERGRVSRGFIGVGLTDVTPTLQRALNLTVGKGAMIQDVTPGSPAERAGLHPYDIIIEVEGRQVMNNEEVIRDISSRQPGSIARLEVVRDGRAQTVQVKLVERPLRDRTPDGLEDLGPRPRQRQPEPNETPLGLVVRELDRGLVGRLEIPGTINGIVISRVDPTGAGFQALLRRGLVIMEINKRPIATVADYQRIVTAARPGDILVFYVYDPTLTQRSLIAVTVE
ncbi:MAG TPA: trypsin-like peptidase domain-containing protein [Vicinamibacterales bacterium]|nr:trypsin-like peptidase domain-containing protein [Vicinamibacterales bacterium]